MIFMDRFFMHPMQKQSFVQAQCPVYIHCSRRCTEKRSGAAFVQVRMVNCSERMVCSVFLRIEGIDAAGKSRYVLNDVVLPDCNALPHTVFGEDRILSIDRAEVECLKITVERICFADGMIWRKLPRHALMDINECNHCACGMSNLPNIPNCVLCGRNLFAQYVEEPAPAVTTEMFDYPRQYEQVLPAERFGAMPIYERPAPIIRTQLPPMELPETDQGYSRRLKVGLVLLLLLALAVVAGFFLYAYKEGLIG